MKIGITRIDHVIGRPKCQAPGCTRLATVINDSPPHGAWRESSLVLCTDCGMRLSESLLAACSDLIRALNNRRP